MRKNEIDNILSQLLDSYVNVSDINITVGKPFQVESDGELKSVNLKPPVLQLTPFQTEIFALNLIQGNPKLLQTLLKTGSVDCSYQLGTKARFRVNIFSQRGSYSIVLRKLSTKIPSIEELGLSQSFYNMADERNGLILVTGATGSGKSTTLASLLRHIGETKAVHIITLEDPIEFEHSQLKATFNQREIGVDVDTFASGLKAALREAPKVILVGEIRDRESIEIALTAAETGHLVLSSLHTINAGQTINRMVGMFDKEEADLVRMRLSETIRWIVCQKLVPKINNGRIAVLEIMTRTMRTQEIIIKGESVDKQFYDVITEGSVYGMQTFDQHLLSLFESGIISEESAKNYCSRKNFISQGIDKIKANRGIQTFDGPNLEMQEQKAYRGENPNIIMPTKTIPKIEETKKNTLHENAVLSMATKTSISIPQPFFPPKSAQSKESILPNSLVRESQPSHLPRLQVPVQPNDLAKGQPEQPQSSKLASSKKNFSTQEIVNLELDN